MNGIDVSRSSLDRLADMAWEAREHARILGKTRVGCAVLTAGGAMFVGCNVEHRYRSHDIHAEVNAIGSMIAGGSQQLTAVVVVAERERFTPCGACMDWIMEFATEECVVAFQGSRTGEITLYSTHQLMPFYPR